MKHEIIPVGPLSTNCHLVLLENEKTLLIIDPGAEAELICAAAKNMQWDTARILLTHAHIDHISAAGKVAAELGIGEVELAEGDMELYNSPENSFMPYFRRAADLPPGRAFKPIPGVKIVPLPGHTQGGTGFLFTEANGSSFLISGDTIFSGSIGRTDLPGGNYGMLINSIRSSILALPEETVIYPGHGSSTNVAFERVTNPFLS